MSQKQEELIDIRSWILRILKNWYWFVLSCAICGAIGGYKYLTTTPKFKVDASIMLRSGDDSFAAFDLVSSMIGIGDSKVADDEVELLVSRDLMLQTIDELDLRTEYRKYDKMKWVGQYPNPDIRMTCPPVYWDTLRRGVNVQIKVRKKDYLVKVRYGRWGFSRHKVEDLSIPFETCAGQLSFAIANPSEIEVGDKYRISTMPFLSLISLYKGRILATPIKKESKIINIATVSDMPVKSRDFIKKQIELYNLQAVIDKNIVASNTATFIDERLRLIEEELSVAENDVELYKKQNSIVSLPEEAELLVLESVEYRKALAETETQLQLIQFVGEFVADESKANSLIPTNLGIMDEALVLLIEQYNTELLTRMRVQRTATVDNPILTQLDAQLAMLRENVLVSISNVRNSLQITKNALTSRYDQAMSQRRNVPSKERQYIEVLRQKELKEELYLFLFKQREENALKLASTVTPAKVIAAPQMNPIPVSPRLRIIAMVCLLFGLAIPVGCMIVHDIMNNQISDDSKELEKKLMVPLGGVLVKNHHGNHVAVRDGENSASAELFRTLRTNLRFMLPNDGKTPVILVTSSVNGEGKSYVATNLAISLTLLGKRVALVGLDIRKPMLATYLNLPSQGCLTSYIAEPAYTVDDTIVESGINNLDILPAGVIPPNPSELLQSERMDELFEELRKRYDYVIIDSAPVAMVGDTYLLNRLADMTVYVTRANYTTNDLIEFINQTHEQHRLPKMVAVLNGADAKKVGYGYGYGYGTQTKNKRL